VIRANGCGCGVSYCYYQEILLVWLILHVWSPSGTCTGILFSCRNSNSGQTYVHAGDEIALPLKKEARVHFEVLPPLPRPLLSTSVKMSIPPVSLSKDPTIKQDLAKALMALQINH
jgi:hypothetical protein